MGDSLEHFPANDGLKRRLEGGSKKPPQTEDFYKTLRTYKTQTVTRMTPASVEKTEKKITDPEEDVLAKERLEALAKRRLEISIELENSVNLWFDLTSKALGPEVVRKK